MEKELRELGLEHYESKALALLLHEKLDLRELSDKSNIPFGKVYSVVKNLKDKGLIKETNSRPKLIYTENASEIISKLIDNKKRREMETVERLKEMASKIDLTKNKETRFFQIGTSIRENKEIQLRSFNESKKEVLQILNVHHNPQSNRESKNLWEKAILEAIERKVIFKAIYPKNLELPINIKKLNTKYSKEFQIKRFNTDFVRCDIIDNDKIMIKLVQKDPLQFGGILFIENERLNQNLKNIFYELWNESDNV